MHLKIIKEKIPLISPNINDVISDFYDEKIGNINKIIYELKNYTGENYIITGYRGAGKTTFIKFIESKVIDKKNLFVFVDYPVSKGYYTLLKQIIRNLYISVQKSTLIDKNVKNEILSEMEELYKSTFTEITKDNNTINLNKNSKITKKEIDIMDLVLYLIGIFSILLYFFNYFVSINNWILFNIMLIDVSFIFIKQIGTFFKIKKEEINENIFENKSLINIKSYYDDDISENHLKDLLQFFRIKGLNITFVIDELDKIENENDIDDIINNIKPLLLSGLANFIIVSGQSILHQIHKGMIESDKVINSLFSKNIHIPLPHNSYFHEIFSKFIAENNLFLDINETKIFVDSLILSSRKNLRNFIINIKEEINWDKDCNPYINLGNIKINKNESLILNIIEKIEEIHIQNYSHGIRDYLIELLYIWINRIFIKNSIEFRKEDIIQYNSKNEYIKQYDKLIGLLGDIFLDELSKKQILIKNGDLYNLNIEVKANPNNFNVHTIENIFLDYFITFEKVSKETLKYFGIKKRSFASIILFLNDKFNLDIDLIISNIRNSIVHGEKINEKSYVTINFYVKEFPIIILTIIRKYTLDVLEKYFFNKGYIGTNLNSDFSINADIYSDIKMFDFVFLKDKNKINIDIKYNDFSINNYINYKDFLKEKEIYIIIFYYDYKKINGFQKIQDLNKVLEKNGIKNIHLINNSEDRWIINSGTTQSYLDKIINNNYYQEKEGVLYSYDNIFTTGIKSIDNNIKIFSKELILIASYPIEISTNFLLNLYINKFNEGENGLFISNNMVKEKMIQKVLNIFGDKIGVDDIEQLGELKNSEFHDLYEIGDGIVSSMLLNSINYKEITNHIDETTSFIMIDNIQTYSNSEKEYNDFIKFLKELAVKYNLTIFISSSIPLKKIESRHNKIPTMGDLVNYSESLVNLTNLVITLYKEEYYDEFTDRKGIIDVFINNSQKTKIELFDKNGRFLEVEKQ